MHQAAIADWSEQKGNRQIESKNARPQIAIRFHHRLTRTESYIVEDAAVFAKRYLAFGASIEIIEDGLRNSVFCDPAKVIDTNDAR
jgi:hypothetical protein